MRIDFRRSLLLAVAFAVTAMLVITSDRSSPSAHALGQGSRAAYGRSIDRPILTVRRREARFRASREAQSLASQKTQLRTSRESQLRASRSALRSRLAPAPATSRPARALRQAVAPADDVWAKLRHCEAGGRYDANSGNGYYGAYQFSAGTWRNLGYTGLPHRAAPEVQDEAARKLQARSGWGQWPACSRRIGAR